MIYLPDTNVWIAYLNAGDSPVKTHFLHHSVQEIALCAVVKAELLYGAHRSTKRDANFRLLEMLFREFVSLPFDDVAAHHYGRIRATLAARGTPIGPNDLMIAATALAHDLTLVTHNTNEFRRVEGLSLEDWVLA
jgi:tRNA(fMet)-specific endonuclease VapC